MKTLEQYTKVMIDKFPKDKIGTSIISGTKFPNQTAEIYLSLLVILYPSNIKRYLYLIPNWNWFIVVNIIARFCPININLYESELDALKKEEETVWYSIIATLIEYHPEYLDKWTHKILSKWRGSGLEYLFEKDSYWYNKWKHKWE